MSVSPVQRDRPAETVAGFMATAAIFASLVGIVYRPVRVEPVAIFVALVAAGIGGRHQRLAGFAVAVGGVCWLLGMTIAVLAGHRLW